MRLAKAVRSYFDTHLSSELAYTIDPDEVVASHAEAGITTMWNLPYVHKPGISADLNAATAKLSAFHSRSDVEVIPGCTLHPLDDAAEILATARRQGARILKLHCSVGAFSADDLALDPAWQLVTEWRMPVVVHVGHDHSGQTTAEELHPIEAVAKRHPGARIVIAHAGYPAHQATLALLDEHEHVFADLTPVVDHQVPLAAEQLEHYSHRLLFGTDAPNTGLHARRLLRWLAEAPISPEAYRRITHGTADDLVAALVPSG